MPSSTFEHRYLCVIMGVSARARTCAVSGWPHPSFATFKCSMPASVTCAAVQVSSAVHTFVHAIHAASARVLIARHAESAGSTGAARYDHFRSPREVRTAAFAVAARLMIHVILLNDKCKCAFVTVCWPCVCWACVKCTSGCARQGTGRNTSRRHICPSVSYLDCACFVQG
jgi:hypothetical protein